MVDSSGKRAFGWLERVVSWESNINEEHSACVWGVVRSHDCRLPCELVFFIEWTSRTVGGRVFTEVNKFFLDSFEGHVLELNYNFLFALIKA